MDDAAIIESEQVSSTSTWIKISESELELVISFGHFWWRCEGGEIKIDSVKIDGDGQKTLTQGKTYEGITIEGENFQQGAKVRLGENITIESISVNSNTEIVISAKVASDAKPDRRSLIVINPDCGVGMIDIEVTS